MKTYNLLKTQGKNFEIVFCSSDRDETSFKEYFNEMPWLALPFGDNRKKLLSQRFEVSGKSLVPMIFMRWGTYSRGGGNIQVLEGGGGGCFKGRV